MRVLVTGGAGFIGSHVVDALLDAGHEAVVIDDLSTGARENLNAQSQFIEMDVIDNGLEQIFSEHRFDCVFHLAAYIDLRKSLLEPAQTIKVNYDGSKNVFDNALKHKVKKVIFASTSAVYGAPKRYPIKEKKKADPLSPYGRGKLEAEQYLKKLDLASTILRYANVYGPRQNYSGEGGVVAIFSHRMVNHMPCTINGDGEQTRDFVYVSDVVNANIKALDQDFSGPVNIGTGQETSINQLGEKIKALTGAQSSLNHGPDVVGDIKRSVLDNNLAKEKLGWQPQVSLDEGLKKTIGYFKRS